ncbi:MAG: hypothetical protein ACKVWV_17950 [Planctomycetota bacterium]
MLSVLGITLVLPAIFRPQSPVDEAVQRPLVVNGRAIEAEEIQRELIYGVGAPMLDAIVSRFFVEHRVDVAALGPASPSVSVALGRVAEPTDEMITTVTRHDLEQAADLTPPLTRDAVLRRRYHVAEWSARVLRENLRFNQVFLPNDPQAWPDVVVDTLSAIHGEDVRAWGAYEFELFRARATKSGMPLVLEQSLQWPSFRRALQHAWRSRWNVKTAHDGLSSAAVLTADFDGDGRPEWTLRTIEAWCAVADGIDPSEVVIARRWIAAVHAILDQLERDGVPFEPQPTRAYLEEIESRNARCTDHAVHVKDLGFPSVNSYCVYRDLLAAFAWLVERDAAADEERRWPALARVKETRVDAATSGAVKAEFLLVSAYDFPDCQWKANGWRDASTRAEAIRAELARAASIETSGANAPESKARGWSELLDAHSEFWDGVRPTNGKVNKIAWRVRGRFTMSDRWSWNSLLREAPYTRITNGFSIADHVFHEQPVGTIEGPFRGPHGYYFARVIERKAPRWSPSRGDAKQREHVRAAAIELAFLDYARDALAHADIQGLEDR